MTNSGLGKGDLAVDDDVVAPLQGRDDDIDIATVSEIFPAFAFHRVAVDGQPVDEALVRRVIDGCVLPLVQSVCGVVHST